MTQEKILDLKITLTKQSFTNNQIMFGTLIGLTHYLYISQIQFQVKQ